MSAYLEAAYRAIKHTTRRHFLWKCTTGLGAMALASMVDPKSLGAKADGVIPDSDHPLLARPPHFTPKVKSVIFLHMAGAPSSLELFDYKPELEKLHGRDCPPSLLEGKRFAFIKGTPKMLGPQTRFNRHGQSGAWVSHVMPHFAKVVDEVAFLKALYTEEINHAPAQLLVHTGAPRPGRPSMGSWSVYGLGSENANLPGFVVLLSGTNQPDAGKHVWGSGFVPTVYQGVQCRSEGEPVLYLSDPEGMDRQLRRKSIDALNQINRLKYEEVRDPEILTRISQYEMAFRMQTSVPEVMDIGREPEWVHQLYGTEPGKASYANNCLLARRLVEQGVRFVLLFHWGWDSHGAARWEALNAGFLDRCEEVDRPTAALLQDLKQRGLLDETLVVWGGEFGRTPMLENRRGDDNPFVGRDHHKECFTMWMAGGGLKKGYTYGETDEIGYYGIQGQVHVHDLQATILQLLGMDHERLTYHFQGRDFRLTDVHGRVIQEILA